MLSDAEQRRLAEIETLLRVHDPMFLQRFDAGWRRPHRLLQAAVCVTVLATIIAVGGLLLGSIPVTTLGLLSIGAAAHVWASHRSNGRPSRRD